MRSLHDRVPTAAHYYRVTDESFRALCPDASGHMNMGLWPANSLRQAQEALVGLALEQATKAWAALGLRPEPRGILDLGSGWGGSRPLFYEAFPHSPYFGVNVSQLQVQAAMAANQRVPNTNYVTTAVENVTELPWRDVDLVFSIEAAFHFEDKAALIRAARREARVVTLLEICVEDTDVLANPLLSPSLRNAWSTGRYDTTFVDAGFGRPVVQDLSERVFGGFMSFLNTLDETAYRGRRAVLEQVRRATDVLVRAAARRQVRYALISASA